MRFDETTLAKRKPLWVALSDLFLDTELQDFHHKYIARTMKESGYSLDEIHDILMNEVFPVLIPNMHSVAGEWAGFDEDWLYSKIQATKPPGLIKRWYCRKDFWMIKNDWEKILALYELQKS